jgi:uronate dehydrogenase
MKTILLTGAAGGVAGMIRPLLRPHYRLRLSDRGPVADRDGAEEEVTADLGDPAALARAAAGVDGIVHLGGQSVEAAWPVILAANIEGTFNLFEAARQQGVGRIVFASSNHAVGFYRRDETIGAEAAPKPDSRYGLSKAFGESLGGLYAGRYGLSVLSIRIGNVAGRPLDRRRLAIWISPRDLVQLIRIGLDGDWDGHEVVYGMSDNARAWWDNANALRLGYRPQDRSEDFAAEVLARTEPPPSDPRIALYQGGTFTVAEEGGDPFKPAPGG